MKSIRNNMTRLQVLHLASGEILSLPPRATAVIDEEEMSSDIEIKASFNAVTVTTVAPIADPDNVD